MSSTAVLAEPQPVIHSAAAEKTMDRAESRNGLLAALFVMGFTTFLNVYATQPLLPRFRNLFHASELLVSLTVSATVLAIAISAPVIGSLADAIGRKRVIVTSILALSIPTLLAGLSANLPQLIAWRFLQGIFVPGIIAVAMAYISEESPGHLVGSTMATYVSGTVLGGFCGRFLSGLTAARWGWQAAFAGLGVLTILGGLATLRYLPRSRKFVRQRNAMASFRQMFRHMGNPQLLATYAVGFNVLFALVGAFTYVNFYLADKPFRLGPTGLASVFGVYLIGSILTPYSGRVLDRIGYRRGVVWAAVMAISGMLLTLVHSLPVVIVGLTLGASGAFACQAAASSHVGKAAGRARSSAAGLYVALYYLGGCFGSVLPGFLWKPLGWAGCVAIIVGVQAATAGIAHHFWADYDDVSGRTRLTRRCIPSCANPLVG